MEALVIAIWSLSTNYLLTTYHKNNKFIIRILRSIENECLVLLSLIKWSYFGLPILFCTLHFLGCGIPGIKGAIESTTKSSQRWPWIAALYKKQRDEIQHFCGGVLITEQHILTAAHCTDGYVKYENKVKQFINFK